MKFTNIFEVKNEADFLELMEEIDKELKEKDLAIFQRPTHAWFKISSTFNLNLTSFPVKREINEGCYTGDDLTLRIYRWYEQRYGSRLDMDFSWRIPILIRDDIYPARVNNQRYGFTPLHILIDGLTEKYSNSINDEDKSKIVRLVEFNYEARKNISQKDSILLIRQAIGDIDASVFHLLEQSPQYGLAKWASLQASEKVLKAFIESKNAVFPPIHNLTQLKTLAESLGLKPLNQTIIDKVQCNAGVRYGNPSVSKIEALLAHHNSLSICSFVTQQM